MSEPTIEDINPIIQKFEAAQEIYSEALAIAANLRLCPDFLEELVEAMQRNIRLVSMVTELAETESTGKKIVVRHPLSSYSPFPGIHIEELRDEAHNE